MPSRPILLLRYRGLDKSCAARIWTSASGRRQLRSKGPAYALVGWKIY